MSYRPSCFICQGSAPASSIAKAVAYALNIEKELRCFLDDPRVNIDNNACENVIRPFCIGRKNWLFVGTPDGGTSMAILASFAAVCKDNDVDFELWLADVLYRLDTTPAARAVELHPHEWKKLRDAEANLETPWPPGRGGRPTLSRLKGEPGAAGKISQTIDACHRG